MKCPTDSATLVMSERAGVEIDDCPECRGVWLDRGFHKILERAEAEMSRSAARPPAPTHDAAVTARDRPTTTGRYHRSEGSSGYRGKKKEHWLGELFG